MTYIHPLFDSKIEEVQPPKLAEALGFKVAIAPEPDYIEDHAILYVYDQGHVNTFYELWKPEAPDGYELGGKYETEDGPYAFFVKPETLSAMALWKWANETNMGMEEPKTKRPNFMTDDHMSLINQLQTKGFDGAHCVFAIESRYPTIKLEQAMHMVKYWESLFETCAHCGDVFAKENLLFEEENGFYGVCDECLADMQD